MARVIKRDFVGLGDLILRRRLRQMVSAAKRDSPGTITGEGDILAFLMRRAEFADYAAAAMV